MKNNLVVVTLSKKVTDNIFLSGYAVRGTKHFIMAFH